jgi:hypothetical protein
MATLYTFTLRPGVTLRDAVVTYGGATLDVDSALAAGGGAIEATHESLATALRDLRTNGDTLLVEGPRAVEFDYSLITSRAIDLDPSAGSGSDGDPIAQLDDQTGNGRHATAAGSNRPTLKTGANGINGLAVAQFDGVDDMMATTWSLPVATAYTAYLVEAWSTLNDGTWFSTADGGSGAFGDLARIRNASGSPSLRVFSNGAFVDAATLHPAGAGLVTIRNSSVSGGAAANLRIRVNGVQQYSGNVSRSTTISHPLIIGRPSSTVGNFFNGKFGRLIIATASHSDGEMAAIEAALMTKYGL